jgi:hypothetical protein
MLLFRDEEHVDKWCTSRDLPRGGAMTPEQGWRLAHAWFKDRLKPGWHRYTIEETEALFGSIGLTGDFWSVRP